MKNKPITIYWLSKWEKSDDEQAYFALLAVPVVGEAGYVATPVSLASELYETGVGAELLWDEVHTALNQVADIMDVHGLVYDPERDLKGLLLDKGIEMDRIIDLDLEDNENHKQQNSAVDRESTDKN